MPNDPIARWENEGGAVLPGSDLHDPRDANREGEGANRADQKTTANGVAAASPVPSQHDRRSPRTGGA
jgi:hypothetical protein